MIEVVAAVIEFEGRLLAFKRGTAKYEYVENKFEFPGGKISEGETHEEALIRELKEELLLSANISEFITTITHIYPDFSIVMHCYLVNLEKFDGILTEHTEYAHISLIDADKLDWIEADRPVLEILKDKYLNVFTK
jgi:8-oxo-dGTP diphosphatase